MKLINLSLIKGYIMTTSQHPFSALMNIDSILEAILASSKSLTEQKYPPYNLEVVTDNNFKLTLAVAGFKKENLAIKLENNTLTITGTVPNQEAPKADRKFVHKGIAERQFEMALKLPDHVKVSEAKLEDGLLNIFLDRIVPEELKPKTIDIN